MTMVNSKIQAYEQSLSEFDHALAWLKQYKPDQYQSYFLAVADRRRKVKKLIRAWKTAPSIAAYGKSQVGKSHLINCILQQDGKDFNITENGRTYNFIEQMNPRTTDTEATGVITRFSSFNHNPELYSSEHPIMMRLLSLVDVALILSDGYYCDLTNFVCYSESELNELSDQLYARYSSQSGIAQKVVTADEIFDMKDYFMSHLNNAQNYRRTKYFDTLALVCHSIPLSELPDVLSVLWHKDEHVTALFRRLQGTLEKLRFSEILYLPAEALLHDNDNENTIMSVQCLNALKYEHSDRLTDVYLRSGDSFETIKDVMKCELSAVCAEINLKIDEKFLESSGEYSTESITDARVRQMLNGKIVEKSILKTCDLLDFPGARSRLNLLSQNLSNTENLTLILLRGKVAYFFNKYNDSQTLNVLLYCHDRAQNDVTGIYLLLNDWVQKYVGKTPEERAERIMKLGHVAPLFHVGLKFNMDMAEDVTSSGNEKNALLRRWKDRFSKVLYRECLGGDGVEWVNNWERDGGKFQNCFLLRDFKYSGENASKVYAGYSTTGRETELLVPESYYQQLRQSFIESDDVHQFFADPAFSWDVAASQNNDGSLYILERLTTITKSIIPSRDEQIESLLKQNYREMYKFLKEFYASSDNSEILKDNVRRARAIGRDFDFTCNSDNYFFGHLLQTLQLSETICYSIVHKMIQGPEMVNTMLDFADYEIIHSRCQKQGLPLNSVSKEADKWSILMRVYDFESVEEAQEYLRKRNVDAQKLFRGDFVRKTNSCLIADAIFELWEKRITAPEFYNTMISSSTVDENVLHNLVGNMLSVAHQIGLADKMGKEISEYVDVMHVASKYESLVADMLSNMINRFVMNFGFDMMTEDERANAKQLATEFNLPTFNYIAREQKHVYDDSEMESMFNQLSPSNQCLVPSFENSYWSWMEYMYVSFIAHIAIPTQAEREASAELKPILDNLKANI